MSTRDLMPCGTEAAARRHYRHGQPLDGACADAARRAHNERIGSDPYSHTAQYAAQPAARNGVPIVGYTYGAARPSWALEAIRAAEARYGAPENDDGAAWDREAG
jgi:hypothetical protein